jgi:hypothetical protein
MPTTRKEETTMANIGDTFAVGSKCPQTGRYRHAACANTEIYNRGNTFAPCSNVNCPSRGANWKLVTKLT